MYLSKTKIVSFIITVVMLFTSVGGVTASLDDMTVTTKPLSSSTMEQLSNRHIHTFSDEIVKSIFDLEEFDLIAESDKIALYFNEKGDTLRILNKDSGYVWGALPLTNARNLNKSWREYGASIVSITCFDSKNMSKRYGLQSNATTTYSLTDDGLKCQAVYDSLGISLDFSVRVEKDRILFEVDGNSVKENGNYKLGTVAFMPYLGSSYEDETDGYIFLPDGSGALMRFSAPRTYISNYYKRVYGKDLAVDLLTDPIDLNCYRPNDYIVGEKQVVLPVYGIVHGAYQNGLFAVIEDGEEYSAISASPAAPNNRYNRIHTEFLFRQTYNKSVNRKEGAGMVVPQPFLNQVNPKLALYVVDGDQANYDGMAVLYRNYLKQKDILTDKIESGDLPLRLEVLGADKVRTIFGYGKRVFTDFTQTVGMVQTLNDKGITNIDLTFKHYTANDEAGRKLRSDLGNVKAMQTLIDTVEQNGNFYFYLDPMSANYNQINLRLEAANNLATMPFKYERDNSFILYPYTYFYRLNLVEQRIRSSLNSVYGRNAAFAVDYLPNTSYGDFTSGKESTRKSNLDKIDSMLGLLAEKGKIPMYSPNQYALKYCNAFYDAPVCSSQFLYETDCVPFLEIALNGSIKTFGEMLNVGTYSHARLLRYVEYGVSLSFVATQCETLLLADTPEQDLISTCFSDWEGAIKEAYDFVNGALKHVYGSSILTHRAIQDGLIEVTYDNGVTILVNYTDAELQYNGATVSAGSYFVAH